MAGGKETPRQKMISMMYLVLTAMLALQVSNSILKKFVVLDNSLVSSNAIANDTNDDRVKSIEAAVENSIQLPLDFRLSVSFQQILERERK